MALRCTCRRRRGQPKKVFECLRLVAKDSGGMSIWAVIAMVAANVGVGVLIQTARHQ